MRTDAQRKKRREQRARKAARTKAREGLQGMICPYCQQPAQLITGAQLYPHRPDLSHKKLYRCHGCDAHVGCHPGSTRPLGRLANKVLRARKMAAHAAFDPIWRSGQLSRSAAYAWLAEQLEIDPKDTHIGMFDVSMCDKVIHACQQRRVHNTPPELHA